MKTDFRQAYKNIEYVLRRAEKILFFAHSRPDPDTLGANIALWQYLREQHKDVEIACFDSFPQYLEKLFPGLVLLKPDQLDMASYDVVVACDSVDRGFHLVRSRCSEEQVVVLIDHHPDIRLVGDINVIDPEYSSSSELVFDLLEFMGVSLTHALATPLLMGIIADTGNFQHSSTTARVLEVASKLMQAGAELERITETLFGSKNVSTLKLWGRAFVKAKVNPKNGMIVSALTQVDIDECQPSMDDIKQVATLLNTIPKTSFSLLFAQLDKNTVKGSLRSESHKGVDVAAIARQFGGGGHRLASGFEIRGQIKETALGWEIV
jgi:phosphoesterase RecJ-like protein